MRWTRIAVLVGGLSCVLAVGSMLAKGTEQETAAPSAIDPLGSEGEAPSRSNADTQRDEAEGVQAVEQDPARVALAARSAVAGRVLQSGAPVPGCILEVWRNWGLRDPERLAQATADGEGRFVASDVPPGAVTIAFVGPSVPQPWVKRGLTVPHEGTLELGDLEVPVGGALRGRVVDAEGDPVIGIRVFRFHRPGWSIGSFDHETLDPDEVRQPSVQTGADGDFAFDVLPPGNHYLLIEPPASMNLIEHEEERKLAEGEAVDLGTIALKRGAEVSGRVFDTKGRALAGVRVSPSAGLHQTPARRRAVETGADGGFTVRGAQKPIDIFVEAEGYRPQELSPRAGDPPLVVELEATLAIRGRVQGQGDASTTVILERDYRGAQAPAWVTGQLDTPHPVAADGTFRIGGLGPGSYELHALAEAVGASPSVSFELPRGTDAPLEVTIVPAIARTVRVIDDTGRLLAGVSVHCDTEARSVERLRRGLSLPRDDTFLRMLLWRPRAAVSDEHGVARVAIQPGAAVVLGAAPDAHLPACIVVEAGERAEPDTLILPRAGFIRGKLDDATGRRHFALAVACITSDDPDASSGAHQWRADAAGQCASGPLPPGRYRLAVYRYDMTWLDDPADRMPEPIALLGDGIDPRGQVEVDLAAGETEEVAMQMPPLGSLRGTVLQGSTPVAGAIVYAIDPDGKVPSGFGTSEPDSKRIERHAPHTTTDAEGRFVFAYAEPKSWELRARAPGAALPAPPVRVTATNYAQDIVQDIALGAGAVTGQIELASFQLGERGTAGLQAFLFPLERADRDPFHAPHHVLPQTWSLRAEKIGADGGFSFNAVRDGAFVLRVVAGMDRMLVQRVVRVAGQPIDLGVLRPVPGVRVTLRCADERVVGVWLRQPEPGSERGVFVAAVPAERGTIAFPELAPGSYLVEPFGPHAFDMDEFGLSGPSLDTVIPIRIAADASVDPAQLELPASAGTGERPR